MASAVNYHNCLFKCGTLLRFMDGSDGSCALEGILEAETPNMRCDI